MQMLSLLPEAIHAINMHAEWIVEAFQKHAAKTQPPVVAPARNVTVPGSKLLSIKNLNHSPGATSESDKDDEVLSFTPRKRSVGSRSESPANTSHPLSSTHSDSSRNNAMSLSSSDEAITNSSPHTPPESVGALSPPSGKGRSPDLAIGHIPRFTLVSPHAHALRDELHHVVQEKDAVALRRAFDDSRRMSLSDDDTLATSVPPVGKTTRSGSAGSLPTPFPANFVDAKDLLRRRREEATFGISSSAQPSDDET